MAAQFMLARFGLEVKAPCSWTDQDAERAINKMEDVVDKELEALAQKLREIVPGTSIEVDRGRM